MSQIWPDATSAGSSPNRRIPCSKCVPLRKELDGWDPEDDPWAEHVSHAKVWLAFPLKNDASVVQGKCAFVNLGKKASELTVADVRGDCRWSLVQLFLQVLGVLEPAKNRMVLTKVLFHSSFTKIVTYIHFKVEEMWEAQFTEEATATRREIDNLAPKCGWKIWYFAAKFSIVYKTSLIICSFAAFII